jgi:PAS domain S-box-containing protein
MQITGRVLILHAERRDFLSLQGFFRNHLPGIDLLYSPPGEEGFSLCLLQQPDLVLLDVLSAGMHGIELVRRLKADDTLKRTPLLAFSLRRSGRDAGILALETGADAFLAAPIADKVLESTVRNLLRMKTLEDIAGDGGRELLDRLHQYNQRLEAASNDRLEAEEKIRVEREFASQVMNAMGQGLTITNSDGRIQYTNLAYANLLGYPPGEILGREPEEFTHEEDIPVLKVARKLRQSGQSNSYEVRLLTKNGKAVPVIITGVPYFRGGQVAGTIASITNITDLKQKEKELTKLSKEYERIFTGSREALFLVGVINEQVFRYVRNNRTHQEKTGLRLEDILGKTPVELLGMELGTKIEANYRRCLARRHPISYEEEVTLPAGKRLWSTTLTPILENEKITFIVGSSSDITRLKELESRLEQLEATASPTSHARKTQ